MTWLILESSAAFFRFTIGNFLTMLLIVVFGVAGYYRLRGVKNQELESAANFWREQADGLTETLKESRTRVEELSESVQEQRRLKHQALTELAAEKLKTDVSEVLRQIAELHRAILDRFEQSEQRQAEVMREQAEVMRELIQAIAALHPNP